MRNALATRLTRALLAAALTFPLSVAALPFSSVFVFGDSLVDSGNNAAAIDFGALVPFGIPPGTREAVPIANDAFIPTPPYASGRYSNGPVWVEQFAGAMGLGAAPALTGGTNFAFGGARTGPLDPTFTALPPSLLTQTALFTALLGGSAPSSALYVLNGGGNDVRDALDAILGGADPLATITTTTTNFVANILTMLTNLSAIGADNFLLSTVPDVGATPAVHAAGVGATQVATFVAASMNAALFNALALQPVSLLDHLKILDLFALGQQALFDPAALGLNDVTTACAAHIATCDPNATFFWDGIHPTTYGHRLIADVALRTFGLPGLIPEPGMVALLCLCIAALALNRRRVRQTN